MFDNQFLRRNTVSCRRQKSPNKMRLSETSPVHPLPNTSLDPLPNYPRSIGYWSSRKRFPTGANNFPLCFMELRGRLRDVIFHLTATCVTFSSGKIRREYTQIICNGLYCLCNLCIARRQTPEGGGALAKATVCIRHLKINGLVHGWTLNWWMNK